MRTINKAAVIGSGVMGSGIAAHLANAGLTCLLLDLPPGVLTPQETAAGYSLSHPAVRNRLATDAIAKLKKTNPAPLYDERFAERIRPGNLEDDLPQLADVDWIIEVVTERLDVKRSVMAFIEQVWKPGIIVSSNTSGISIEAIAAPCGEELRQHFMGTHFFNPPRYMPLVEVIPGPDTSPGLVGGMKRFIEKVLGKGVVVAKDTPNFIANRIGTYGLLVTLDEMLQGGYSVEEVDAVTGPALGRPKSATFRTLDLVGLDTFLHVADNVFQRSDSIAEKAVFQTPPLLEALVKRGWIGEKAGQGFYKKTTGPSGRVIVSLNPETLEYRPGPAGKISSPAMEEAKAAKGAAAKTRALIHGDADDRYAQLAWNIMKRVWLYAAERLGEIADSIPDIDQAMKRGFNWELGPFEAWDAAGLLETVARMEQEGLVLPDWLHSWLKVGRTSFYDETRDGRRWVAAATSAGPVYRELKDNPEFLSLHRIKERGGVITGNAGASLIDLGDGIACLEFHSKSNAIGADILAMISRSVDVVKANYNALVIANEGRNFCVGANLMLLLMEAQDEAWDEVDRIIRTFQDSMMRLKGLGKPVVAAPHRMTLGGGVEACMPADRVVAAAETYYGLVEAGVGLIPAGGGCKELALRISEAWHVWNAPELDVQPLLNKAFETVGMAKVSGSAHEAARLGLLRPTDRIVLQPERLLYEAKRSALALAAEGARKTPPAANRIRVAGAPGKAVLELGAYTLRQGRYISDHDYKIARKLAHVLAGGDLPAGTLVSEQHMLDLEREAFLSLCGEPKTQQRMQHMLSTGKPLRN
ncbi:3-hydroxyacyl-CoA dehydrogenase/enoyl-CoA hydratase family protein [Paenibacillus koleovorans]|uniref:3-hydroxyacyl-CoA dehydrogenase/enoyl-CoA hydratase family protein n=1 Tax=Paenibacillus koleovorans TaxID=121608 RepID=UPI000FD8BCCD|nr:3-hydroxyacyl-CoA dehydrogenase/enoyl-CoA hydratase family protein [Paenibacillus koleovorans]